MTGKLQSMIDQANRRTEAGRKKQFMKKATDAQLLESLLAAVEEVLMGRAKGDENRVNQGIIRLSEQYKLAKGRSK